MSCLLASVLEFFETDYKEEDTDSSTSGGISQSRGWEVSWLHFLTVLFTIVLQLPKEPFQLRQDLDQRYCKTEKMYDTCILSIEIIRWMITNQTTPAKGMYMSDGVAHLG